MRRFLNDKLKVPLALSIVGLVALLGVTFAETYFRVEESEVITESEFSFVDIDTYSEWTDYYLIHATYPVVEKAGVNKIVKAYVENLIADFNEEVNPLTFIFSENPDLAVSELNINHEITLDNGEILSFHIDSYKYLADTGVTEYETETFIFDLENEKRLHLYDFFDDTTNYLSTIEEAVDKSFFSTEGEAFINTEKYKVGTQPILENFDHFVFRPDNESLQVEFYFSPGSVGPIEDGVYSTLVNLDDLDTILNEERLARVSEAFVEHIQNERERAAEEARILQDRSASLNVPDSSTGRVDCTVEKCIALTFDDGPSNETDRLLSILNENNAKATFFMIGVNIPYKEDIIRRASDAGHLIGSHSWSHKQLTALNSEQRREEFVKGTEALNNVLGYSPMYFRAPYGAVDNNVLSEIDAVFVGWNIDPADWRDRNADVVYERVISDVKSGGIVLSHDIYPSTVDAYARIIPELQSEGYTLVTVQDLLGIDPNNPPTNQIFYSK